jgi:hypothetical protein
MKKPKDLEEVRNFIRDKLIEEYGDAVLISSDESKNIVIDTETKYKGNSDVWIDLCYFH